MSWKHVVPTKPALGFNFEKKLPPPNEPKVLRPNEIHLVFSALKSKVITIITTAYTNA